MGLNFVITVTVRAFTVFLFTYSAQFKAAVSMLKQDYREGEITLSLAFTLTMKVLNKTTTSASCL